MDARQVLLGVQGIRMGGLLHRRQAPAMAIMASVATVVCCGLMRQGQVSQVRGTVSLQQTGQGKGPGARAPDVELLPPSVLHAAHQAYVQGVKDGERHVEEMREPRRVSSDMLYTRGTAGRDVSDAAIRWVRKWEDLGAEAIKSGALGRLKSKQELLLGLQASTVHGHQGDSDPQRFIAVLLPSWRQFAFRPVDVPTRTKMSQLDLIRLADKTNEDDEKEKMGEEREVSKEKEQHDADKVCTACLSCTVCLKLVHLCPLLHKNSREAFFL